MKRSIVRSAPLSALLAAAALAPAPPARADEFPSAILDVQCGFHESLPPPRKKPKCEDMKEHEGILQVRLEYWQRGVLLGSEDYPVLLHKRDGHNESVLVKVDGDGDPAAFAALYDAPATSVLHKPDVWIRVVNLRKSKQGLVVAMQPLLPYGRAVWADHSGDSGGLQADIDAEVARAKQAEQVEHQHHIDGDAALRAALDAETARARAAEASLAGDVANEAAARVAAINLEHQHHIDGDAALQAALDAETARARAAEATLANDLGNEVARAKAAEATLANDLAAEAARAVAAEGAEAMARAAADATLQGNIDIEHAHHTAYENLLASIGVVNDPNNPVDWTRLKNVPGQIAAPPANGFVVLAPVAAQAWNAGVGILLDNRGADDTFAFQSNGVTALRLSSDGNTLEFASGDGAPKTIASHLARLALQSDQDVYIRLDANDDDASSLRVLDGGGNTVFRIDEAGVATGDGSGLVNLDGSNVALGTVANARLVNGGQLTVQAGLGLGGGGAVALGGSVTLTNTGVLDVTAGGVLSSSGGQNPAITLTGIVPAPNGGTGLPGSMGTLFLRGDGMGGWMSGAIAVPDLPGLAGLYVDLTSNQTIAGVKTFLSPIVGDVTGTASGFTGSLAGDVTGPQGATLVARINGQPLGATTPTAGNLLVASGATWISTALGGDATLDAAGVLTIANGAVTNPKIGADAVTSAKIANGTIAFADWNGNGCAAGQVPKFDGANWACADDIAAAAVGQGITQTRQTANTQLAGNNSGTYTNGTGRGWTAPTFQDVPGLSVTRTVVNPDQVQISVKVSGYGNDLFYYAPQVVAFRVVRDGATEIGRSEVLSNEDTYYYYYWNASITVSDAVAAGAHTWQVQYWVSNDVGGATESIFVEDRVLSALEIKP